MSDEKMLEFLGLPENLDFLLELEPKIPKVKEHLMTSFTEKLKENLKKEFQGWEVEGDLPDLGADGYLQVFKPAWENVVVFAIQAERSDLRDIYFGICRAKEGIVLPGERQVYETAKGLKGFGDADFESGWYIAYKDADDPYRNMSEATGLKELSARMERAVEYFTDKFRQLRQSTETLIDDAVKKYKANKPSK